MQFQPRRSVGAVSARYTDTPIIGNIILDDADLSTAIPMAINACYLNNGQACIAASRLIVPEERLDEVKRLAKAAVEKSGGGEWLLLRFPASLDEECAAALHAGGPQLQRRRRRAELEVLRMNQIGSLDRELR